MPTTNPLDWNPLNTNPVTPKKVTPFANTDTGIAINTVKALPGATLQVAKDIAQGTLRSFMSLGNTLIGSITNDPNRKVYQVPKELQPWLGATEVRDLPTQYKDAETRIATSPTAKKYGVDKFAGPLAFGAVLGTSLLDYSPWGGSSKKAVNALVKETDETVIKGLLREMGSTPSIADKLAPDIARASNTREVQSLLDTIKGLNAMEASAKAKAAGATDVTNMSRGDIKKVTDDLKANKAPIKDSIVYHGTTAKFDPNEIKGFGLHFGTRAQAQKRIDETLDNNEVDLKTMTDDLGYKYERNLVPASLDIQNPVTITDPGTHQWDANYIAKELKDRGYIDKDVDLNIKNEEDYSGIRAELEKNGYDGAVYDNVHEGEGKSYIAFNPSQITVREQAEMLDDLLERANRDGIKSLTANEANMLAEYKAFKREDKGLRESSISRSAPDEGMTDEMKAALAGVNATQQKYAKSPANTVMDLLKDPENGKHWSSLIKGFVGDKPPKEKVHIFDYLGTPEFVLEKLGLAKGAQLLQAAKDRSVKTLRAEIDKLAAWKDRVKDPGSSFRIFRYLDGRAIDTKKAMSPEEIEVAKEIKVYLKEWANRLGLPEDARISNYITHIFERKVQKQGDAEATSVFDDPIMLEIMKGTPAKSVYDPFLQKRENAPNYIEDVWRALDAYVKRASRKESFDPALEELSGMAQKLQGSAYEYVTKLSHQINMRPTDADKLFDDFITQLPGVGYKFTDRPVAFLTRKLRQTFYRGTLGLNVASALRNLSQGANTYAKLGERYTVGGYATLFGKLMTKNLEELYDEGILSDALIQDRRLGVYKSFMERLDPMLFSMFDLAEKINRGAAYYGAKARGVNKGLDPDQAKKYAKRIVRETQFAFGDVDSPVALGSDLVKTALQLQSYNTKQIEFLGRMVKNKEIGGLIRYSLAALTFVYTIGKMFGMKPEQLLPSVEVGGSPFLGFAGGLLGLINPNEFDKDIKEKDFQRGLVDIVPGGAQIKKTVQGIEAYNKGRDTTPSGNTRFKIEQDTPTFLKAAIFGKSSLDAAQEYYEKQEEKGKKKEKKGKPRL